MQPKCMRSEAYKCMHKGTKKGGPKREASTDLVGRFFSTMISHNFVNKLPTLIICKVVSALGVLLNINLSRT